MNFSYRFFNNIIIFVSIFTFSSCVSSKKVVYLNNVADSLNNEVTIAKTDFENPIQKNDLLSISVGGSNLEDLSALNSGSGSLPGVTATGTASKSIGFLVESDGKIQFPFLGRISVAGLTRLQLEDTLTTLLKDYTKNPVVNVKFLNYNFTVLGEVSRPGRFEMDNERTTILDALGQANDLTIYGKRNNILVVREVNGEREFGRINLLSKNVFKSPYYYIKTKDVIYVEPVSSKFLTRTGAPQYIGIAAAGITLVLTLINLSKP